MNSPLPFRVGEPELPPVESTRERQESEGVCWEPHLETLDQNITRRASGSGRRKIGG
jgi:hypothetical protein